MKTLFYAALLIMAIVFGVSYFSSSMASLDAGTDVQGSAYQDAFADTSETSTSVLGLLSYVASVVGVGILIAAVWAMNRIRLS